MTTYRIINTRSGMDLGVYPGHTKAEALEALARDAGYRSLSAMLAATTGGTGADLEVVEVGDESEIAECVYCGRESPLVPVPAVDDDGAWETLAADHAPDCEWISTRAHRV